MESRQNTPQKDSTSLNAAFKKFGNKESNNSKRYSSGGYRQRSYLSETMDLDKNLIGRVIGKGGANIQLVISSNNLEKIKAAKEVVTKFMSENNNRRDFRRGNHVKQKHVPQIFNMEEELTKGAFPTFREAYPAIYCN